jgi:hypothetical protein
MLGDFIVGCHRLSPTHYSQGSPLDARHNNQPQSAEDGTWRTSDGLSRHLSKLIWFALPQRGRRPPGRSLERSGGKTLLLHAGHVFGISSASQPETIGPFFAANLCLAIDVGSLKRPRVVSLRRINGNKIWRRCLAARGDTYSAYRRYKDKERPHSHERYPNLGSSRK